MKKLLSIAFVLMLAISLTACGSGATNGGNPAKKSEVSKSSSKMSREEGQEKLMELSEKLMNGEITPEESKKLQKEIQSNMESQEDFIKRTNDNILDFDGMPSWAKSLNINEPVGLKLVTSESRVIKAKGAYSDGFTAVYEGDKEKLMSEARRIAEELGLSVDFEDAASGTLMLSGDVDKYSVIITVADNGKGTRMSYVASDLSAQEELMKKHNK